MSIQKNTANDFVLKSINYTAIPTEIIEKITNPDALAILAYLCSKPVDSIIIKSEFVNHFELGRSIARQAINDLLDLGALYKEKTRLTNGKWKGTRFNLSDMATLVTTEIEENNVTINQGVTSK